MSWKLDQATEKKDEHTANVKILYILTLKLVNFVFFY